MKNNPKHKVITLTGPHGSWKDTIISEMLKKLPTSKKVISSTDRLPRNGEVPWYTYHYETNIPEAHEIYDAIKVPSLNTRTQLVWVNYWITKQYVESLFLENNNTSYLWHTAPSVIHKLKKDFQKEVFCIHLHTDINILIDRLCKRDNISPEQAMHRLSNDPWNIESQQYNNYNHVFDVSINTNRDINKILNEILQHIHY